MDQVNVYWLSYHQPEILARGYWDQGLLEDIFKQGNFTHHTGIPAEVEGGGVVIINGRTHITDEDVEAINTDIAKLDWVLFIETGDEEASFPWRKIKHKLMRFWVMLPRMTFHDDTHYKLANGYRPDTHQLLEEAGQQERNKDWFFAGQVNHERREQCVQELKYFRDSGENPNGTLITTDTFGKEELAYKDYLTIMAQTKIVCCPSGIESPDNFRLYEALEAGCLPVVDAFSTNFKTPGFWPYLFGKDIPFPIIGYWDAFHELMPELLKQWPANANRCFAWWQGQKRMLKWQLFDDIKELSK